MIICCAFRDKRQRGDLSYIKFMVKDHQEDIAEFEMEAASGQDSDAKVFAATFS